MQSIKRGLHIETGEGRLVVLFLIHSFCNGITIGFMGASISALFLMRYTASDLPVMYIVSTSATFLTGLAYHRLSQHIPFRRLLSFNLGYSFLLILSLTMLHRFVDAPFPALLLAASFELIWVMNSLEFWGLAGKLLDVQQAKRLYGIFGAGEVVAIILSGMLIPFVVPLIGTANLLFIALGGTGASWLMMRIITHRYADSVMQTTTTPIESTTQPARIFNSRYAIMVFALVGLAVSTLYILDTAFYEQASRLYPTEESLASFLGIFFSLAGILQLLSRAVFTGRLLKRYGVMVGLMIFPILLIIGAVGVFIGVGVGDMMLIAWAVIAMKWLDRGLRYTHNQSAILVLYQPFPINQRVPMQTIAEGNVEPVAGFIVGLSLLFMTTGLGFGTVELMLLLSVICLVWFMIIVALRKPYVETIVQTLTMHRITATDSALVEVVVLDAQELPHIPNPDSEAIQQNIIQEAERALTFLESEVETSQVAYQTKIRHAKENILHLLAKLIHPPQLIHEIEHHIFVPEKERRAYAQEALELLLMPPLKNVVMPLFEDLPIDEQATKLRDALERIWFDEV